MKTERLTASESLSLDIVRTLAAMVVAFGHLTQPYFSDATRDYTFLAFDAVAVFFVLSGFVIRYVTCRRPTTFGNYLDDRASRIYSVAAPALLLTVITDSIAKHANPGFYSHWAVGNPFNCIALNLVFCGQIWNHLRSPLSNSPYWSVNYEVGYYVLYGFFFYVGGRKRWFWIAALCLFEGWRLVVLAPLWIAGCLAHDAYQRWNAQGTIVRNLSLLTLAAAAIVAFYLAQVRTGFASNNLQLLAWIEYGFTHTMLKPATYIFGIAWVPIFLWLIYLSRSFTIDPQWRSVRVTKFIAEGTFPVYLCHFPLFVVIAACIPYNHAAFLPRFCMFVAVVGAATLCGHPCNVLKEKMRNLNLPAMFGRRRVMSKETLVP